MGDPPLSYIIGQILNPELCSADLLSIFFSVLSILILIFLSALYSGSENAFFSLTKAQINELIEIPGATSRAIIFLLRYPKKLLATILIANTFVNIAIVLISTYLFATVFNFRLFPLTGFLVEVVIVTFMLVLFGEVMPKIYSFQHNTKVTRFVAVPMYSSFKLFQPFVYLLEKSTSIIDKRITKKGHILTLDELTHAIDITSEKDSPRQERNILKGIVNFGSTHVKQIMRQRPDIVAMELSVGFKELILQIVDSGYSRIPIYEHNLDHIKGILFTKDLLPHINEPDDFKWQSLIRKPFFIPESKKIDDLLKEFQSKRMHVAIVVDEFGGTEGLVSMEDILEEIFGEIQDEFDKEEQVFTKINDHTFVFEGKMIINGACKYMDVNPDIFDEIRNEAETLGGILLELNSFLPKLGQEIVYKNFTFKIESVDKRKINRIKITFTSDTHVQ